MQNKLKFQKAFLKFVKLILKYKYKIVQKIKTSKGFLEKIEIFLEDLLYQIYSHIIRLQQLRKCGFGARTDKHKKKKNRAQKQAHSYT